MKTFAYKFKISDVIETYKKRIRESVDKETEAYNYTTAIYEPPVEKKTDVKGRTVFVNLNALVNSLIKKDNIKMGYVVCASNHTTSGVYVNHFETGIMEDLNAYLNKEHPFTPSKYKHNIWDHTFVNADAHLKAMDVGKSATVLIIDGKLQLGKFEDIIYAEFDYRPDKTFTVALFGGEDE